jgi:large subunit ribosomal protein L3
MMGLFLTGGAYVPVTVIEAGPCVVTQIKTTEKDGYGALQLAFGDKKRARVNKPMRGHLNKSGRESCSVLKEFRVENPKDYKLGQTLGLDEFSVGELVNVIGISKGRGFSGVIKRHGFSGGQKTHGSRSHRIPGSIGCSAWPGKVIKGKKLPGQYGNDRKTIKNLEIIDIRPEENLIMVKGAVPGFRTGIVTIQKGGGGKPSAG